MDEVQQIVEDFHDLLIPDALEYYLGFNEDFDMLGMDEDGESGDEDEDEDGEQKKPKKAAQGGAAGQEGQQECKQQ
jgi:hypothetical protein